MNEPSDSMNSLKKNVVSRFIKRLTPDQAVPTISNAINLIESYEENEDERTEVFHTARQVSKGCHFAYNAPTKRPNYKKLIVSQEAIKDLNVNLTNERDQEMFSQIVCGEKIYYSQEQNIFPYSIAYAGFQFGDFAGQLGDGRLVNLFDLKDTNGIYQTLQIKGSGLTPFSRFGDGKAILQSSIKEFIISESLYHIGIPSTRALQLTLLPGTKALRSKLEPTAVVCRFAPSWVRIGNFDLFSWKPDFDGLVKLTDYCIEEIFNGGADFPRGLDLKVFKNDFLPNEDQKNSRADPDVNNESLDSLTKLTKYDLFFRHVVNLNARTVAYWQTYGFLNGVLNTDNTSIMGLSMDFGPFSFLDKFQPDFTPNHDDSLKRYSFQNQPSIIWWNLVQLVQPLAILVGPGPSMIDEVLEKGYEGLTEEMGKEMVNRVNKLLKCCANEYKVEFSSRYAMLFGKRLGINLDINLEACSSIKDVERITTVTKEFLSTIVEPLLKILQFTQIDYNNFFLNLQNYADEITINCNKRNAIKGLDIEYLRIFFNEGMLKEIIQLHDNIDTNVKLSGYDSLLNDTLDDLIEWTDSYSRLVSVNYKERKKASQQYNPLFIPRSWIFEEVINDLVDRQAEQLQDPNGTIDTTLLEKLHLMSSNPYDSSKWNGSLLPDVAERWTATEHVSEEEERDKYMKQSSCSS